MISRLHIMACALAVGLAGSGFAQDKNAAAPADGPVADVLGTSIPHGQKALAPIIIFSSLIEEYATTNGIKVTDGEIEAYKVAARKKFAADKADLEKEKSRLQLKLEAPILPAADRARTQEYISQIDGTIAMIDADLQPGEELRFNGKAKGAIQSWKVGKSLFERYGGRVIARSGEPEPFEAYVRFLQDKEKEGAFHIFDPQVSASLWGSFTNASKLAQWIVPEQDSAKAMNSPWWIHAKP